MSKVTDAATNAFASATILALISFKGLPKNSKLQLGKEDVRRTQYGETLD